MAIQLPADIQTAFKQVSELVNTLDKKAYSVLTEIEIKVLSQFAKIGWASERADMLTIERNLKNLEQVYKENPKAVTTQAVEDLRQGIARMEAACKALKKSILPNSGYNKSTVDRMAHDLQTLKDAVFPKAGDLAKAAPQPRATQPPPLPAKNKEVERLDKTAEQGKTNPQRDNLIAILRSKPKRAHQLKRADQKTPKEQKVTITTTDVPMGVDEKDKAARQAKAKAKEEASLVDQHAAEIARRSEMNKEKANAFFDSEEAMPNTDLTLERGETRAEQKARGMPDIKLAAEAKAKAYEERANELTKTQYTEKRKLNVPEGFEQKFGFATAGYQKKIQTMKQAAEKGEVISKTGYAAVAKKGDVKETPVDKAYKDQESVQVQAAPEKASVSKAKTTTEWQTVGPKGKPLKPTTASGVVVEEEKPPKKVEAQPKATAQPEWRGVGKGGKARPLTSEEAVAFEKPVTAKPPKEKPKEVVGEIAAEQPRVATEQTRVATVSAPKPDKRLELEQSMKALVEYAKQHCRLEATLSQSSSRLAFLPGIGALAKALSSGRELEKLLAKKTSEMKQEEVDNHYLALLELVQMGLVQEKFARWRDANEIPGPIDILPGNIELNRIYRRAAEAYNAF